MKMGATNGFGGAAVAAADAGVECSMWFGSAINCQLMAE